MLADRRLRDVEFFGSCRTAVVFIDVIEDFEFVEIR
jgi:hypothetical protein